MGRKRCDLVVIGSGPAGQKAAFCAAKQGKRVALVERKAMMGGVCVHTGTIPSKTLREAILYLTGFRQRTFYGQNYTVKERITVRDLAFRVRAVVQHEIEVVRSQLRRNNVDVVIGTGRFGGPNLVLVDGPEGITEIETDYTMVACGTRPAHSDKVVLDGERIVDSDQLLLAQEIPRNLIIVGAGIIGLEYASMLSAMDIKITLVELRDHLLDFVDHEIVEALTYHMRRRGITLRLGEKVVSVSKEDDNRVVALLESGKRVLGDGLLYTIGRQGNSDLLDIEKAGLEADKRGRLKVDCNYRTSVPSIYAGGDIIGFPALASSSMEQGRLAASHMFGIPANSTPELIPYGVFTIPELSMVGPTEQELTRNKVPYEVGVAKFEEVSKGQIVGDQIGLLKLLFSPDDRKLLSVHIMGEAASELVHIGQAVLNYGGTIEYFRDTVFNYPTLAEAYKVAALDGLNRLG